jgi:hypothetical protein
MAKEVTHAVEFRDSVQPDIGPDRYLLVLVCDDGSIYEFQKMEDAPIWNLRARGNRDDPRHQWTHRSAPLPNDVTSVLNDRLGEKKWQK